MDRLEIEGIIQENKAFLTKEYNICKIGLFGSYSRNEQISVYLLSKFSLPIEADLRIIIINPELIWIGCIIRRIGKIDQHRWRVTQHPITMRYASRDKECRTLISTHIMD